MTGDGPSASRDEISAPAAGTQMGGYERMEPEVAEISVFILRGDSGGLQDAVQGLPALFRPKYR